MVSSIVIESTTIQNEQNNNTDFDYSKFSFNSVDYTFFIFLLGISAGIGAYYGFFAKSENTTEEYLMGGRKMKILPIAISLMASQMSAIAIMTIPSEVFAFGTNYFWVVLSIVAVLPVLSYIIVPVFYNNNISNCYEYLEMRFDKRTRRIITFAFIFKVYLMIPIYPFLPSLAFSQVTGINIHIINAVVCSVCIFYTMLGGIKAVVWTDVIQALVMIGSVSLVAVLAILKVGGISEVFYRANVGGRFQMFNFTLDLTTRSTVWNCFLGGFIMWISHLGVHQCCVQRIVSLPSLSLARRSLLIFTIGFLIMMSLNCLTGIVMFARYYLCDPVKAGIVEKHDKLMPFFVQDVIGHLKGIPGIFISCVFSAALSTMSANLNTLGALVYFDYIKPFIQHTESRANFIMKIMVVINGVYCIIGGFLVEKFSSILQIASSITGMTQGAVAGVFLFGMLYPKAHAKAAFYGTIFSILTMAILVIGTQLQIAAGLYKYQPIETTIEGCDDFNMTVTNPQILSMPLENESIPIFRVAFFWYNFMGALLVWVIGIPLSHLTEDDDKKKLDINLMPPCIQRFIPKTLLKDEEIPLKSEYKNNLKETIIPNIIDEKN